MTPMTLTVPAKQEWALVLRMATSGVGALYNLPLDLMDDLCTAVEESCDLLLRIPIYGAASSLNVGCAASICLYEIARQRDFDGHR